MGRTFCRNGHTSHQSDKAARTCEARGRVFDVTVAVTMTLRVTANDKVYAMKAGLESAAQKMKTAKVKRVKFGTVLEVKELTR